MDLIEWIDQIGPTKISKMLGVSREAINQWKRCETSPKTMIAYEIIQKTHGMLDWDGIYMPFVRKQLAYKDPNQASLFDHIKE